jgi:hypothetical protein
LATFHGLMMLWAVAGSAMRTVALTFLSLHEALWHEACGMANE